MRTAKRTGIAALFAVFFALLLAGCLCLGLPAKREAQAAEGAVSEEEIDYNVSSIDGISTPLELMEAYTKVATGQVTDSTITLAGNIQLDMVNDITITGAFPNGHLELPKSVTFDLDGHTLNVITGGELCINIGQTVEGTTLTQSTVTIEGGTLIGQSSGHFAIVQAGSTLNLSNVDVQFKNAEGDGQTTRPAAVAVNGRSGDADAAILNVNNVMFSKLENAVPVFVGDLPSNQGTVNFTSDDPLTNLRDQINASSKDHQVETELTENINGSLVVPEYANITIDLNGNTITNTAEQGQYATITNHGTLIIDGSNGGAVKATSAAKMSSSNDDDYTPYAVYNYGMLTAKNATITAEATASGTSTEDPDKPTASVYIRAYGIYNDAGSATLENCTVSASSASTSSYAVYNTKGALSITNGAFTAGKAELTTSGTPLYSLNSGSSVTVKGGTFTANGSSPYGIYVKSAQKAEIIGATVTSSKVGIYFYNIVETAKLSDSQVTVNAKTSKSYNVYVYGCGLEMDSVQLKTTASGTTAHGVYTGSLKSLTIKGNSSIETTSDNGSLVPLSINGTDAEVNLEQCSIPNGAIEVYGGATVNISGGQFGGVELDVRKGAFHITGGTFDSVPDLTMLADNYAIYKENGKYVVKTDDGNATLSKNNVAMIGDTGYNTLSDAIGAAQEGQTVTLLKSVEEDVTVSSGAVTLDLNGNTLTGNISVSGGSLSVVGSGKVTGTVGATDGTLQISGGSYANLIAADYLAEGYVLKASRNSDGVLTVEVVKGAPLASMMIGETEYKFIDLASALSAAPYDQSSEIVLLQDITLDADDTLTIYLENKEIKLDLGGKTIEATVEFDRGTSSFITVVNGAKLTICNGTIKRVAPANDGAVALIDVHSHNAGAPAKLTLKQDLTIEQSGNIAVFIYGYATLNTAAKIHVTGDGVIQSNGSENYAGKTVINITGGELTSDDDVAIFHPQNGELNISGGTVSGATAIYMRSGSLNVSGDAVIKATGAKNEGYPESGYTATGDAIVIRSSNYPGGAPVPSITGGTISSESASAVVSTAVEGAAAAENFISNGTFSEELPVEYLDEGMAQLVETDSDGNVSVTVGKAEDISASENAVAMLNGTTVYTSLQAAITAAGEGATVTLLKNVSESVTIEKGKNITLDLGDNTLEGSAGDKWTIWNKGTLTVKNGKVIGNTSAIFNGVNSEDEDVSTQMSDATLTLEKVTLEAKVTAAVTLNNSSAKIVSITDSTITAPTGATALQNSGAITSITDTTIKAESGLFKGKAIVLSGNVDLEGSGVIEKLTGGSITGEIRVAANASGQAGSIVIENCTMTDATFVCGDDYYMIATEKGYTAGAQDMVMEAGAVAAIGNIAYTSLQAAIDAAGEGATVTLLKNITESVTIEKDKNITLDLNGQTLTNAEGSHTITNYGTLTITDSSENGTVDNESHGCGALVNYGMATLSGGTFTRSKEAGKSPSDNGGNSWYVIDNHCGTMIIQDGVTVKATGRHSSLIRNVGESGSPATLNVVGGNFTNAFNTLKNDDYGTMNISGNAVITSTAETAVNNWGTLIVSGSPTITGETGISVYSWMNDYDTEVTVSGGTITGTAAFYISDGVTSSGVEHQGGKITLNIQGGTIRGAIQEDATYPLDEEDSVAISNGKFDTVFPSAYLAENAVLVKTAEGFKALDANSEAAKDYVAEVSDPDAETAVRYETLAAAITAAKDGDTVKLCANVALTKALTINKSVTIDLAGYTISAPATAANITADATIKSSADGGTIKYTGKGSDHGLIVTNDATLTLESVTVDYEGAGQAVKLGTFVDNKPTEKSGNAVLNGVTVKGGQAGVIVLGTQKDSDYGASLKVTNSNISGTIYYGIVTNGMGYNTSITLENTNVSAPEGSGTAMYLPGEGETTITGGTITGATGIEIRAGKLTINEGTKITATGDYEEPVANPSGTTVGGVAVAVSQHTTQLAINVAITGGTFNATGKDGKAFLEIDTVVKEDAEPSEGVTASITGGAFDASVEARNITGFISGTGVKFSKMPKMDYFAENCIAEYKAETGKYETKEGSWVAAIDEEGYASLQDAINAAENGETIILRADIGSAETPATAEEIVVDKAGAKITLDLKGKSIYVTNGDNDVNTGLKFINLKAGTLSIINSEEGGGVISASGRAFQIVPEEKVEAKLVLGKGVKVHAVGGPAVFIMPDGAANVSDGSAYYAVLESAADLSTDSTYGAIQGNGTAHGTFITINGGTLSSQGNVIYHPQYGKLVINGGTFESPIAGVEVRAGELIVNGGKFNIGGTFKCEYNGNGATIEGAAIAVSQHTTDLPLEFTIAGGTFNSDADGKAFYQAATISENTAPVTGEIKGGEFNGEVGAATLTGFIEGGDFGVKPADELMNEDYAAEYVNGRYVAVPSTALQEARLAAQADVRAYAAAKGIDWSQIEAAAEDESAVKVLAAYNAIAEAMSTLAVAKAKVAAFDAVDDYAAATGADAKLVAEAIKAIEKAAEASEGQTAVVVPTATYAAIYAAETKAELEYLKDNALAEIADIRAYRGEIAAQAEKLETLAAAIAAIDGGLFGTEDAQGAIKDIRDAIAAAQEAITNGDGTTSTSLKQIYDYLNGTLKSAVDDISKMLNGAVSEGGILYEMQETLEALDATVNGDGTEDPALLEKLNTAIAAAQEAINGNTASEMREAVEDITEAITAAQEVIIAALPDYKETLGEIAGSVDKLEELLGGTNGLAAIKKGIDDALTAIGTADGETLFEQLAAIESGNTAIKTTVDELAAALTGTDGAIATLTAALTAMQGDITELTGALAEDAGWVAKDIAAAQTEIDKLTAAVGKLGTVDGKDLAAVVGEIADGLEEMDATVNSIASTVSAASAVEEAKTQAAADIRTWLEGYLEELAGDTAQADVLARAAYTVETTEGELYKDISAQFGEENGKLVLKYYNEALAAIDAATTVSDVTTAVATFRAQVASIEASAGNSTDLTVVYVLLGVVLLVLIIACIVALVKGGRQPEPAPAQAAPAEKPAEAQPEEKAEEKEEQAEEAAPAEEHAGEMAPAEEESAAAEDDDKERVVISANVRTFDEAYQDLTDEQRELFNKVKEYALAKEDAVEVKQSGGVVIKRKSKQIVKLTVRRDMPVALFLLENEMLKDFRRNAKSEAKLKVRATELVIREADDLETAYTMVDLSVEQIEKDLEAAKERRREARRQRRLQRQAEEAAAEQAEGAGEPAPAEEPASAESAATDGTDTE